MSAATTSNSQATPVTDPSKPWISVDLEALSGNYRFLARQAAGSLGAVVKANAYGLGAPSCAATLARAGCEEFFVATVEEGVVLRETLADASIFVMAPPDEIDVEKLAQAQLFPCLYSLAQLRRYIAQNHSGIPAIALQVDTGMNRLGLAATELDSAASLISNGSTPLAFIMSHLACADDPESTANKEQLALFESARSRFPGVPVSLANSGAVLLSAEYSSGLSRAGIGLYGVDPQRVEQQRVKAVATFSAPIIQVRDVAPGEGVGYGLRFRASVPSRVAIVAAGYADGVQRRWGESVAVAPEFAVNATRVPVAGRVSMDLTALDVTNCPEVSPGDRVEIFGASVNISRQAELAGTIAYDLLTAVGDRVQRIYR